MYDGRNNEAPPLPTIGVFVPFTVQYLPPPPPPTT